VRGPYAVVKGATVWWGRGPRARRAGRGTMITALWEAPSCQWARARAAAAGRPGCRALALSRRSAGETIVARPFETGVGHP
jgi:hypothetical protein